MAIGFSPYALYGCTTVCGGGGVIGGLDVGAWLCVVNAASPLVGGVISGVPYAKELTLLFQELDLTTVSRPSILSYGISIWLVPAMGGVGRWQANRLDRVFGLYWC
ncbi:MAG: hypothetical protein ABJP79_13540 [Tateyamaria sp.]|uniref:hypothetical protein n=1 Tax=Tateyamaria sp. TaxID=1929288 RepID=UPI00329E3936